MKTQGKWKKKKEEEEKRESKQNKKVDIPNKYPAGYTSTKFSQLRNLSYMINVNLICGNMRVLQTQLPNNRR